MNTTMKSLDTLKIYERFKKAETSEAQAKELAEILRELTDDQLASKNDLEKTKIELQNGLEKFRSELKGDIEKLKVELEAKIAQTKAELEAKIELSKNELRVEIEKNRSELKLEIEKNNVKISQAKVELIKWIAGLLLAQTGVIAALVKLL